MLNRVPVFMKQLRVSISKRMGLKDREGGDVEEFKGTIFDVRQFPKCYKSKEEIV